MKIHLLSDLHLEFKDFAPPPTDADVVVLAGDVHIKGRGVEWAKKTFDKPVVMVMGNHDYWSGSLAHTLKKSEEAAAGSHVHLLHNRAVVIDGVRFLGATLWTDFQLMGNAPLAMWDAQTRMNDFRKIRNASFGRLKPAEILSEHVKSRAFLTDQLYADFDGPTVVVTHHPPTGQAIPQRYRDSGDNLNACYASNLDHLIGDVPLWLHGHIHDSHCLQLGDTRVVCNPRGYDPLELNPDFDPGLVLEV